jgi:hypothetical protein
MFNANEHHADRAWHMLAFQILLLAGADLDTAGSTLTPTLRSGSPAHQPPAVALLAYQLVG